ncbi:SHOCT domain-containing protein [Thermocatellispora tengchongensis]
MRVVLVLFVLAVLAAIVFGGLLLARVRAERKPLPPPADDPKEILKRRYAAGEIDEDEYLRRMSGLSQDW